MVWVTHAVRGRYSSLRSLQTLSVNKHDTICVPAEPFPSRCLRPSLARLNAWRWRLAIRGSGGKRETRERFSWTFPTYFCNVSMRSCDEQGTHHASDHRRWSIILRAGGEGGGTRSDPADHARVFQAESDRTGAHTLRVAGVATAKRRPEEPRVLLIPPGIARSRLASLAVAATQEAASTSGKVGPTQRCAASAYGLDRRLLSPPAAIAHKQR